MILNIAILPSLNHLKSAIRDIQNLMPSCTMEACPKNTTNLIGVYKMACNQCVCVDWSALAFGLGVVLSMASLLLSIMPYSVSRFLGINFMDAYDIYQ